MSRLLGEVSEGETMRKKYQVTLQLDDGTDAKHLLYASNPEHAAKKAAERHGNHPPIVNSVVEEVKDD
jgi:hypothetical protein